MRKSKTNSLSKKKADRYFSEYIRLRDADSSGNVRCITCEKITHWQDADAGHFISRDKKATRYDERNVNAQCKTCNRFQSGRQYEHGKAIDLKYGAGTADELLVLSNQIIKANQAYYESMATTYKELSASQRQSKGPDRTIDLGQ